MENNIRMGHKGIGWWVVEWVSELRCNWQSVSQFVLALSPSGAHDQVLAVDKTITGWGHGAPSLTGWRVCLVTGHRLGSVCNMHVWLTRLFRGISFCKMSSEFLDLQSRFVQQIALEVIHADGCNRCLHDRSYVCPPPGLSRLYFPWRASPRPMVPITTLTWLRITLASFLHSCVT
jgi:hypothetical protein